MGVLIVDNYDSFTYNLYQMVQALTEQEVIVRRNDALAWDELVSMQPERVILSPGPGHPDEPRDFGICADIIRRQPELGCPVLGVCLGHQGMVSHSGGSVEPAPEIVHGKTSEVRILKDSPLLEGLPNPFTAMRYHSWTVAADTLPPEFELIAETDAKNGQRLIMALQHQSRPLYGVQFHPESVGTPEGGRLLRNFLKNCQQASWKP